MVFEFVVCLLAHKVVFFYSGQNVHDAFALCCVKVVTKGPQSSRRQQVIVRPVDQPAESPTTVCLEEIRIVAFRGRTNCDQGLRLRSEG